MPNAANLWTNRLRRRECTMVRTRRRLLGRDRESAISSAFIGSIYKKQSRTYSRNPDAQSQESRRFKLRESTGAQPKEAMKLNLQTLDLKRQKSDSKRQRPSHICHIPQNLCHLSTQVFLVLFHPSLLVPCNISGFYHDTHDRTQPPPPTNIHTDLNPSRTVGKYQIHFLPSQTS